MPHLGRFIPGKKNPVAIVQEAEWAPSQGLSGGGAEISPHTGIRWPHCPARTDESYFMKRVIFVTFILHDKQI